MGNFAFKTDNHEQFKTLYEALQSIQNQLLVLHERVTRLEDLTLHQEREGWEGSPRNRSPIPRVRI